MTTEVFPFHFGNDTLRVVNLGPTFGQLICLEIKRNFHITGEQVIDRPVLRLDGRVSGDFCPKIVELQGASLGLVCVTTEVT